APVKATGRPVSGTRPPGVLVVTKDHTPASLFPPGAGIRHACERPSPNRSWITAGAVLTRSGRVLKINTLWDDSPETKVGDGRSGFCVSNHNFFLVHNGRRLAGH